jgi:hypothetical protein
MLRHRLHDPRLDDLHLVDRLPPDIAERTAERLRLETGAQVRVGDAADELLGLQEEVQTDGDDLAALPAPGVLSGSQVRGIVTWGPIGAGIGAVLGALVGLIPMADLRLGERLGLWVLVGALFGAASGFVFGGGRRPELEGRVRDGSPEVTISVHVADHATAEAADALLSEGDREAATRANRRARIDEQHAFDPMTVTGRPTEAELRRVPTPPDADV